MSQEERQDLNEKVSDDKQADNLEVGNGTSSSDNTTQVSRNSSDLADHNLHHHATEGIEVDPNDVINIEELSHEPLRESSGENSEWRVSYIFPNDDVSESDSRPAQLSGLFHHANLHASHYNQYRALTQIEQQTNIHTEVFDTKSLIKEATDDPCAAGTSGEAERKRKNNSISLMQKKRHNEVQSSKNPTIGYIDDSSDNTSDQFADIEDNVKDSSSSEASSDWISTDVKEKHMPDRDFGFQHRNTIQNESTIEDKSVKLNYEQSSSDSKSSQNKKFVDKTADRTSSPPSLKGEALPLFILSDENKKKFKLSMPTILEVQETESDEQMCQPGQSKTNQLKMKKKVGKRKDKCNVCNVRLGLCAIQCRCGGYYCAKHRYDREHNCTYDYKSMGAAEIQKNNPRIVAEKVRKL